MDPAPGRPDLGAPGSGTGMKEGGFLAFWLPDQSECMCKSPGRMGRTDLVMSTLPGSSA